MNLIVHNEALRELDVMWSLYTCTMKYIQRGSLRYVFSTNRTGQVGVIIL